MNGTRVKEKSEEISQEQNKTVGDGEKEKKPQMSAVKYSVVVGSSRDVQPMIL